MRGQDGRPNDARHLYPSRKPHRTPGRAIALSRAQPQQRRGFGVSPTCSWAGGWDRAHPGHRFGLHVARWLQPPARTPRKSPGLRTTHRTTKRAVHTPFPARFLRESALRRTASVGAAQNDEPAPFRPGRPALHRRAASIRPRAAIRERSPPPRASPKGDARAGFGVSPINISRARRVGQTTFGTQGNIHRRRPKGAQKI